MNISEFFIDNLTEASRWKKELMKLGSDSVGKLKSSGVAKSEA